VPQFQSFNFSDRFIRHRNFHGELTPRGAGEPQDYAFAIVSRGDGRVALRSESFPDRFLRQRDFRIQLDESPGPADARFKLDTTFFLEPGLADPAGISLRSVHFPDRYLRHRDFRLFVEPRDSANLAPDATFFRRQGDER
jgi:hypothetical protein